MLFRSFGTEGVEAGERDVFVHIGVLLEEMVDGLYLTVLGVSGRI